MFNNSGYYIFVGGSTPVAGPFDTVTEAWASLEPEARKGWTWELGEGTMEQRKAAFLAMPLEIFDVVWCMDLP